MNHPRRLRGPAGLGLAFALVLAACGDSDDDTHESHGASTTATTTTEASTTHESHGESTTDATTHDHSTTHDTHDTHDTDTTTGGGDAEGYCACMLVNCHDHYHATWGEDHEASEAMCLAAAEALDDAAFACRMAACDAAADDPAACVDAIGGGACM